MGKIGCVAIVKNEERHIAEWLAWQFFVGFDTVFLFNNESTDRTRAIAEGFAPRYDVRVLDWPGSGQGIQERAYEHAARQLKDEFEWLAFFDADEFLVLDERLDLKTLIGRRGEAAIGIPWAIFGSSGHKDYPGGLQIEVFSRRAASSFPPNAHIKSIVRPQAIRQAFNPHAFGIEGEYVDLRGRKLVFSQPGVLAETPDYDGVKLHHYFTRSWAHWQARLARGNLGTPRTEQDFHDYDRNEIHDDSAARHALEIRRMLYNTLPVMNLRELRARTAAECSAAADAAGFLTRGNTSLTVADAATVELPGVTLYGPGAGRLKFCGPLQQPFAGEAGRPTAFPARIQSPALSLSRLSYVLCLPGQVAMVPPAPQTQPPATLEDYSVVLRESFNSLYGHQTHHALQQDPGELFSLKRVSGPAGRRSGTYIFLDNQHRGHFGHIVADVLSLAWAYQALVMLGRTDVFVLVYDENDALLRSLLKGAGIPPERLISFKEPMLLEEVVFATKSYQTQGYVSPMALETFHAVRDALAGPGMLAEMPKRLYLSRQSNAARQLQNEDEVAQLFAARGFTLVTPETLPIEAQMRLAANAELIAGPTGSNMFHLAFQRDLKKAFVLGSSEFVHATEQFMSAGSGIEMGYYVGEALGDTPHAPWRVNTADLAKAVDDWLGEPLARGGLIFDIGMAEGDDTALYLAKGFRVVGLEPDAKTYYGLCERFAGEIKAETLTVLNYAAGRETGQILEFFHNDKHPRLSGFSAGRPEFASGYTSYHVVTIGWAELVAQYGVPHYAKIDIEGAEVAFLAGAEGVALPAYISVECHDLGPAEALYKLGYRRFQLSDQNPPGGYAWPDPAREGRKAEGVDVNHTSGPFGAELPPDWLDFEAFCAAWRAAKAQGRPTWHDCHATLR
ncbi:MAG: FkbM family methyltransferase [Acidocella sp.]|nr:FkbM family methyltransferase [Acidocella sp.]